MIEIKITTALLSVGLKKPHLKSTLPFAKIYAKAKKEFKMKRLKYYIPVYGAILFARDEYQRDYQKFLESNEIYFKSGMDDWQTGDYFMAALMMQLSIYIYLPWIIHHLLN